MKKQLLFLAFSLVNTLLLAQNVKTASETVMHLG